MKIIFSGGGTLGPVTPLLAMKEAIEKAYPDAEFLWIGTVSGPERELVEGQGIRFITLSSGKLRRYFSLLNFLDMARLIVGFFQSIGILVKEKPDVCISVGGFVSVPLHYAAALFRIPTWIHQQDIQVGLANRLMSVCAKVITVVTTEQKHSFSDKKTFVLGNPVRHELFSGSKQKAKELFGITSSLPVIFVTGGGTGSQAVNSFIVEALPQLEGECEVIHLSGKERSSELTQGAAALYPFYHTYPFFTFEMKHAYALCDIVVSRGGFGSLSELSALKKVAILIPKPGHQEQNVAFLKKSNAVITLDERTDNGLVLAQNIKELLHDSELRIRLAAHLHTLLPPARAEIIVEILQKVV